MLPHLQQAYDRLENERQSMLKEIASKSHEQQNFKADDKTWSLLEVCKHLSHAEKGGVLYLSKKYQGVDTVPRSGLGAAFRTAFLNVSLDMPVKYKAPRVAQIQRSSSAYQLEEIREEWDEVRKEMVAFLDTIKEQEVKKLLFKHPFMGRMNLLQTLSFMRHHITHHHKQVERIQKHPGFPKG